MMHDVVNVQLVEQRVAVFGDGSCEDDHFVYFTDSLEERINARSFYDIHVVILAFDFDWNGEVCLMEDLKNMLV